MNPLNSRSIPKYTQYELSELVSQSANNPEVLLKLTAEDRITLDQITEGNSSFKVKHYTLVSKILNIPINELLEEQKLDTSAHYRSACSNQPGFDRFLNNVESLFGEWIFQKKISSKG